MPIPRKHLQELHELFAAIDTIKEAEMFIEDMFTPQEVESLAERWQLIKQLEQGKPQRQIAKDLNVSICKITKGSRVLKYGRGAFPYFLKKLGKQK